MYVLTVLYCWAYARRKLYELAHNNVVPIAEEGLKQIAALNRIEGQARGASAEDRLALRKTKSATIIAAFKTWLDHARTQVSSKSSTADALKYIVEYWDGLILFLTDGRIVMDSNPVEGTIRPIALQRKTRSWQATTQAFRTGPCSYRSSRCVNSTKQSHPATLPASLQPSSMATSRKTLTSWLPWKFRG